MYYTYDLTQKYGVIPWKDVTNVVVDITYAYKVRAFVSLDEYYHVTSVEDLEKAKEWLFRKREWLDRDITNIKKEIEKHESS